MTLKSFSKIPATPEELVTMVHQWYEECYQIRQQTEAAAIRDKIQGNLDQLPPPLTDHIAVHKFQSYFDKLAMKYSIPNIEVKSKKAIN